MARVGRIEASLDCGGNLRNLCTNTLVGLNPEKGSSRQMERGPRPVDIGSSEPVAPGGSWVPGRVLSGIDRLVYGRQVLAKRLE
jgi:hypothetical protein